PRTPDKVRKNHGHKDDNTILSIVLNHCTVQRIPRFVVVIVYHGKLRNTLRCIIMISPIALDITALVFLINLDNIIYISVHNRENK
ncbi:MAG: hypothetical protein WCF07_10590, partial [Nitrososphaeraceae archaeon]